MHMCIEENGIILDGENIFQYFILHQQKQNVFDPQAYVIKNVMSVKNKLNIQLYFLCQRQCYSFEKHQAFTATSY